MFMVITMYKTMKNRHFMVYRMCTRLKETTSYLSFEQFNFVKKDVDDVDQKK